MYCRYTISHWPPEQRNPPPEHRNPVLHHLPKELPWQPESMALDPHHSPPAGIVRSSSISTASKQHRFELLSHGRPNDGRRRNPQAASASPPAPQIQHLKTHQPGVLIRSHRPTMPDLGSHPSRATMAAVQNPPRSEGTRTNQHRLAHAAPEQAAAQIRPFSNLPISAAAESPPVVQHACDPSKAASMASSGDDPISNPSTEPAMHAKAAAPPSVRSPANLELNQ
ncbi:hypothetical protein ACLOJK_023224 [Asimina triloba]